MEKKTTKNSEISFVAINNTEIEILFQIKIELD